MKLVYMGTPEFAVKPLEKLIEYGRVTGKASVGLVVTQPDRAAGRGKKEIMSPVKECALAHGIEVLQPSRIRYDEETKAAIRAYSPDMIIVAAFGQILPKDVLDIPSVCCVNIHASLLPRWRGASPIQHAILAGDRLTGVTIMKMAEGLDTGDMFAKREVAIGSMDYPELSEELSNAGAELLVENLEGIASGAVKGIPQGEDGASYAGMIGKEQGILDPRETTAEEAERMVRAFRPWPGVTVMRGDTPLKIKAASAFDAPEDAANTPGTVLYASDSGIGIAMKEGILRIEEIQAPGKKSMDAGSFLRGNRIVPGETLGTDR